MNEQLARWRVPPPSCGAESYVQALAEWGRLSGLLSDGDVAGSGRRLAALFHTRGLRKLAGDSASMRVEEAHDVMEGVLYTLGLYLKGLPEAEVALRTLLDTDIDELYKTARLALGRHTKTAKRLWRAVRSTALPTDHIAYRETLLEGAAGFFRWYDMDFAPHQTPGDIDYPLALPFENGGGVEFMRGWLARILLENRFCRRFAPEAVHRVMQRGWPDYRVLLLNLFEPVLLCALGAQLTGEDPIALAPKAPGVQALTPVFSRSPAFCAAGLEHAARDLCASLGIAPDDTLPAYAARVAKQNAAACHAAAQGGRLPRFFFADC